MNVALHDARSTESIKIIQFILYILWFLCIFRLAWLAFLFQFICSLFSSVSVVFFGVYFTFTASLSLNVKLMMLVGI